MTTHYATIDPESGAIYGVGMTSREACVAALDAVGEDDIRLQLPRTRRLLRDLVVVPCSAAAAAYMRKYGGAPDRHLAVSLDGVCLRAALEVRALNALDAPAPSSLLMEERGCGQIGPKDMRCDLHRDGHHLSRVWTMTPKDPEEIHDHWPLCAPSESTGPAMMNEAQVTAAKAARLLLRPTPPEADVADPDYGFDDPAPTEGT